MLHTRPITPNPAGIQRAAFPREKKRIRAYTSGPSQRGMEKIAIMAMTTAADAPSAVRPSSKWNICPPPSRLFQPARPDMEGTGPLELIDEFFFTAGNEDLAAADALQHKGTAAAVQFG